MADARFWDRIAAKYAARPVDDPAAYAAHVESRTAPLAWEEAVPPASGLFESLMMGLRLTEGVDLRRLARRHGIDPEARYADVLDRHQREGLVERSGARLALTPRGLDLTNHVIGAYLPE